MNTRLFHVRTYDADKRSFHKEVSVMTEEELFNHRKAVDFVDVIDTNGTSMNIYSKGTVVYVKDKYNTKHTAKIVQISAIPDFINSKMIVGYDVYYVAEKHSDCRRFYSLTYLKRSNPTLTRKL